MQLLIAVLWSKIFNKLWQFLVRRPAIKLSFPFWIIAERSRTANVAITCLDI